MESTRIEIDTEHDIAVARHAVRSLSVHLGFRLIDQTRLVTVTSELARNIIKYAGRGRMTAQSVFAADGRAGLRLLFEDDGRGIDDVELAMRDGYTTGGGLGKGLPGSRRLVDEFQIDSATGHGTRVTVTKWIT